jgi:hypothetical protein
MRIFPLMFLCSNQLENSELLQTMVLHEDIDVIP